MDEENNVEIQLNVSMIEMPDNPTPEDVGQAILLIEQYNSDNALESSNGSSNSGETVSGEEEALEIEYITKNKQKIWDDLKNDADEEAFLNLASSTGYSPNTCRDIYKNKSILLSQTNDDLFVKEIIAIAKRKLGYQQKPSPNVKTDDSMIAFQKVTDGVANTSQAGGQQLTNEEDENSKELDSIADRMNTNIYDFLLKLPGITTQNIAKVMMKVKNLKELIKMNLEQLTELLGSEGNAKMLWEFIHITHKPVEAESNEK
ncbi:DNA repair endonuclease XPF-like [Sitodiplosis mosellana]|uniref:DNA repair endonuclease XPF-like n=1 Tax=Sitodiplosis mosellana TaxID=263140 RepID=UPI002444A7D9|nr:DNA repair endonuclease XPF-like [Sitodiplosis mosellana]